MYLNCSKYICFLVIDELYFKFLNQLNQLKENKNTVS